MGLEPQMFICRSHPCAANPVAYYVGLVQPCLGSARKCARMYLLVMCNHLHKKPEKDFPRPHETHARRPRGGPTMGRSAEWRPELVELADDSVSSTDATIPSSPRGARSMTGSTEAHLYISNVER